MLIRVLTGLFWRSHTPTNTDHRLPPILPPRRKFKLKSLPETRTRPNNNNNVNDMLIELFETRVSGRDKNKSRDTFYSSP